MKEIDFDDQGWVLLHRRMQQKAWYKDSAFVHLWTHILFRANHKENEIMIRHNIVKIERGEFVCSRKTLSEETGINEHKIDRILQVFEKTEHQIEQLKKPTHRLIKILNYDARQDVSRSMSKRRAGGEQVVSTNKELKEPKELKKKKKKKLSEKKIKKTYRDFIVKEPYSSHEKFMKIWEEFEEYREEIKKPLTYASAKRAFDMFDKVHVRDCILMLEKVFQRGWIAPYALQKNEKSYISDSAKEEWEKKKGNSKPEEKKQRTPEKKDRKPREPQKPVSEATQRMMKEVSEKIKKNKKKMSKKVSMNKDLDSNLDVEKRREILAAQLKKLKK